MGSSSHERQGQESSVCDEERPVENDVGDPSEGLDDSEHSAQPSKAKGRKGSCRGLPFAESLLVTYGWLRFDEITRIAHCVACFKYKLDNALGRGISNFRRVTGTKGTFCAHNKSAEHRRAMERMLSEERRGNILHQISSQSRVDAERGRKAVIAILDVVKTCLRQNIPLRGHDHSQDETADCKGYEQVVVVVRTVSAETMAAQEIFLGWYATESQDGETLFNLAKDSLLRYNLPVDSCCGITTDGAQNMVGSHKGLKTRFKEANPSILHVYCAGHALNLISRQAVKVVDACQAALELVGAISRYIKGSPKRQTEWRNFCADIDNVNSSADIFSDEPEEGSEEGSEDADKSEGEGASKADRRVTLKLLSETRWLMNGKAVHAALENYEALLDFFGQKVGGGEESSEDRARAREFLNGMDCFQTYYSLRVLDDVYTIILPVHAALQSPDLSVCVVRDMVEGLRSTLSCRAQDWPWLTEFYENVKADAAKLNVEGPKLQRAARRGRRATPLTSQQADQLLLVQHVGRIHRALLKALVDLIAIKYACTVSCTVIEKYYTRLHNMESISHVQAGTLSQHVLALSLPRYSTQ
ncbi:hypothetical protein FOZ63_000964 [Perkinsus olseni]|nr:hypothetical protein FOZ63_000964 [Perkinsus olseni]